MRANILVAISEGIESLEGFKSFDGAEASRNKVQFQIGFLRAIESNEDALKVLSDDGGSKECFLESLAEIESLVGAQSRARIFEKEFSAEKMGYYAGRVVLAQTTLKECERELLGLAPQREDSASLAQAERAVPATATALESQAPATVKLNQVGTNAAEKEAQPETRRTRPLRVIDSETGKTIKATTEPAQVSTGASAIRAVKPSAAKPVMSGSDCVDLLESTEREMVDLPNMDDSAPSDQSDSAPKRSPAEIMASLKGLSARFDAQSLKDGESFVRNAPSA